MKRGLRVNVKRTERVQTRVGVVGTSLESRSVFSHGAVLWAIFLQKLAKWEKTKKVIRCHLAGILVNDKMNLKTSICMVKEGKCEADEAQNKSTDRERVQQANAKLAIGLSASLASQQIELLL